MWKLTPFSIACGACCALVACSLVYAVRGKSMKPAGLHCLGNAARYAARINGDYVDSEYWSVTDIDDLAGQCRTELNGSERVGKFTVSGWPSGVLAVGPGKRTIGVRFLLEDCEVIMRRADAEAFSVPDDVSTGIPKVVPEGAQSFIRIRRKAKWIERMLHRCGL